MRQPRVPFRLSNQGWNRERDLALAARGYCTLRITAAMILYQPDAVLTALRAVLSSRPRG